MIRTAIAIVFLAIVGILILALATIITAPDNTNCPTGSAICVTAAAMPGAVSIMSIFIIFVILAAIAVAIIYIRTHSSF